MNYRRKANWVLGSVFLIFLIASWLRYLWPEHQGIHFFHFVSEASLVGGIADWFAVTALFRKPLGWPYHTALIPRNRDKMIDGITGMVQDELLSEALLRKKIESFNIAQWVIKSVEQAGGSHLLAKKFAQLIENTLLKVSTTEVAGKIEKTLKGKFLDMGISKRVLVEARSFLRKREFDLWLDERIEEGLELASQPRIKAMLLQSLGQIQEEQVGNGGMLQKTLLGIFQVTDTLNLDEAAEALQIELILHIRELKEHQHPLRERLKGVFEEQLLVWQGDPTVLNALEDWKNTLVLELELQAILTNVLEQVFNPLRSGLLPSGQPLANVIEPSLKQWWTNFKEDIDLQGRLDKLCQDFLIQALQSEHAVIGQIVRETLEGFDDEELNRFIEDKAGEDLQWIRINGSLVGGVVGAALFVLLNYAYTPFLGLLR
jgi:uncharacterized membrane-anchored protein YjiN (DUF445 family)